MENMEPARIAEIMLHAFDCEGRTVGCPVCKLGENFLNERAEELARAMLVGVPPETAAMEAMKVFTPVVMEINALRGDRMAMSWIMAMTKMCSERAMELVSSLRRDLDRSAVNGESN